MSVPLSSAPSTESANFCGCNVTLLVLTIVVRRQSLDAILKKYGVKPSGGRIAGGTNTAVNLIRNHKLGRKRKAPAEAEMGSNGGEKTRSEGR